MPPPHPPAAPLAPAPPAPPAPPAAPLLPDPWAPAASIGFIKAIGDRNVLYDAFYVDERDRTLDKSKHPVKSFFNVFSDITKYDPATPNYEKVRLFSAWGHFKNPLQDPWAAQTLRQTFGELVRQAQKAARGPLATADIDETKQHFEGEEWYYVFVPGIFRMRYQGAGPAERPKAKIAIFFGVNAEINLFGLRRYFWDSSDSILIGVPGVEKDFPWNKLHVAWGIGISSPIIKQLLAAAGVDGVEFDVDVMAGYSTGYRGLNETIVNGLVDLQSLKRLVYFDAFYVHDDFPLGPVPSARFRQKTARAVEAALTASANANLLVYAYTSSGTPRKTAEALMKGALKRFKSRTKFIDVEFKRNGVRAITDQLYNICLARLIQGGIGDYFEEADVDTNILELIKKLPERGKLGLFGRPGFISVYDWINATPQKAIISKFPQRKAFELVKKNQLLAGWTTSGWYEFRHRDFVQEIGKECLLP